jgi:hypothetical protein
MTSGQATLELLKFNMRFDMGDPEQHRSPS